MNFAAYDNQLLKQADDYLTGEECQPAVIKGVGIPVNNLRELYEWAVRVFDNYEPKELAGKRDWTHELIREDDTCQYLDIEDNYVPMFMEEVQEALIELYGIEEE